jgi:Tol biopolymer transport system component
MDSLTSSVSADGRYVAFVSAATNLVPGDTNGQFDVFVRDRQLGVTERISVSSSGTEGDGFGSLGGTITPGGRFVVFGTYSTNLVPGDTNGAIDVLVRDRLLGTTERVNLGPGGAEANADSDDWMSISDDGRYVAFASEATNLVPGDTNAREDVFVRDRLNGTTERVSVDSAGVQANAASAHPWLSGDGRTVVFRSAATNLVVGDTNGFDDVFVHDRQTGATERVNVSSGGVQTDADSGNRPTISGDGRFVAFDSRATNLVIGDTNGSSDIFVRDRTNATTRRVSVDSSGGQADSGSPYAFVSADGGHVAYASHATNLVPGDTNLSQDVFEHDLGTGATRRLSVATGGAQGNGAADLPAACASGHFVVFASTSSNLVAGDTNGAADIFLSDRYGTGLMAFCIPGEPGVPACPCGNPPAGGGLGCDNFGAGIAPSGKLSASGVASLGSDSIVLLATGENNTSLTVFWQGKDPLPASGVVHGAGVRCVSSTLRRLYTGSASGGAVQRPGGGDPSVSARSAAVGDPIAAGESRHYFTIYRDPSAAGPCGVSNATVNLTNAGTIAWGL